jgi:ParB family chromosome partitioning protein|nr:MAG TPA: chromosome partitioning protein [Caudoviricetes sp.]
MSTGLLNSLMNAQSQTVTPAGQQMQVVMIPSRNIIPNPENFEIYTLGDMENLRDDIRQNGLRQPLEVIPMEDETDCYMLISGHRRWAACGILSTLGDTRFDFLPCLIRESHGKLDDRIALITANATARDLTDGERLAQYEALKDALTKKKAAGQLEGKVRDEVCRILGLSTGAAARLNVIASCENEVIKERLKAGEIGLMEAYRSAQDYARFMGAAPEEPEQKEEPAETVPVNPDYAEWKLPPEAIAIVEKAHEKQKRAQNDAPKPTASPYRTEPVEIHEPPKEQAHGRDTLHKLAEKMLGANAAWELEWEDVRFRLAYYKQPLPGGATLWKRIDTTREDAGQTCDDYAIILQDNSFFTCGWIGFHSGITDILTNYFELK